MKSKLVGIVLVVTALAGCTHGRATSPASRSLEVAVLPSRPRVAAGSAGAGAVARPWLISAGGDHGIEGFADHTSVLAGTPVALFVSTLSVSFRVQAFRMGWYGGALGRLVWTSPSYPGRAQVGPRVIDSATHTVAAPWARSATLQTQGWPSGDYLLRLDASGGGERFVPLAVRESSARGRVVLINAVTTWQAYNPWGCCSLYNGADGQWASRARAVSFDRPYQTGSGAGEFLDRELPMVAEAERIGLPLDYVTDADLQTFPGLLDGARAVVSLGHDEYWSPAMRSALTTARDAGANLAFFGANAIYRRIRMEPSRLGPDRLEVNYKDAAEDPLLGHDDGEVTANWPASPDADPESALLGAQYGCRLHGPNVAGVIVDPDSWLLSGLTTGFGEELPGLVGYEIDAVQLADPTPRPIEILLHSPTNTCPNNKPPYADTTYYEATSGAGVFDAGTTDWVCAIGGTCSAPVPRVTEDTVAAITDRLLTTFARGPARRLAHDNLASLHITR